jgi:hypothetical protein
MWLFPKHPCFALPLQQKKGCCITDSSWEVFEEVGLHDRKDLVEGCGCGDRTHVGSEEKCRSDARIEAAQFECLEVSAVESVGSDDVFVGAE